MEKKNSEHDKRDSTL